MKATKKIVGAACALVAAVALSAGSTFAWFAANTSVNATGMNVTAKSNATFLLISDNENCGTTKKNVDESALSATVAAKYVTTGNDSKTCYPVSYCSTAGELGGLTASGTESGKWYTANNTALDGSGTLVNISSPIDLGNKDYFLTYNVWITLSADSESVTDKKIKVTFNVASGDTALSAVVQVGSDTNVMRLNSTTANDTTAAVVSLSSTSAVKVTVYVYIDGTSTNVNSNYINSNTLSGTAKLSFDLVSST